jgi:pSer/pThr/pTyr-binding forkhead associated (FHA) protein
MSQKKSPDWAVPADTADSGAAYLKCLKDNNVVETIPLDKKSYYVFGRGEQADVVLQHSSISRQHAIIGHHRTGALVLLDLNSGNGTFLGTAQIPANYPTVLKESTIITFGASTRKYIVCGVDIKKKEKIQEQLRQEQLRQQEQLKDHEVQQPDLEEALSAFFADINSSAIYSDAVMNECAATGPQKATPKKLKRVSFGENKVHLIKVFDDIQEDSKPDTSTSNEKEGTMWKNARKIADDADEEEEEESMESKTIGKSPDTVAEAFVATERKVTFYPSVVRKRKVQPAASANTNNRPAKSLKMAQAQLSQVAGLYASLPPTHHTSTPDITNSPTDQQTNQSTDQITPNTDSQLQQKDDPTRLHDATNVHNDKPDLVKYNNITVNVKPDIVNVEVENIFL